MMLGQDSKQEKLYQKEKSNYSSDYIITIKKEYTTLQPKQIEKEFKITLITKTSIKLNTQENKKNSTH